MSDEPQPLRLKPRLPSAGGGPSVPEPPAPPSPPEGAPPPPAPDQSEGGGRLRLKPRLNLAEDKAVQSAPAAPEPFIPPPPDPVPPPPPAPAPAPVAAAAPVA